MERLLSACPRSTPTGRRNDAILVLLARLGRRAGEVVALELDDVDRRAGEPMLRGLVMMERLRITDAIAFDRHFRQYGRFMVL